MEWLVQEPGNAFHFSYRKNNFVLSRGCIEQNFREERRFSFNKTALIIIPVIGSAPYSIPVNVHLVLVSETVSNRKGVFSYSKLLSHISLSLTGIELEQSRHHQCIL